MFLKEYIMMRAMSGDVKEVNGQKCLSAQQAQQVFDAVKNDPAQTFEIGMYCGFRCERSIGKIVEEGVPVSVIGRVMLDARYDPDKYRENAQPFTMYTDKEPDGGSFKKYCRELGIDENLPVIETEEGHTFRFMNGEVRIEGPNREGQLPFGGYKVSDDNFVDIWSDHISATLSVYNPESGEVVDMVIDPFLADEPITMTEWKKRQNCDDAVLTHGKIGQLAKFVTEEGAMTDEFAEEVREAIEAVAPDLAGWDIETALSELDCQQYNEVYLKAMKVPPNYNIAYNDDPRNEAYVLTVVYPELQQDLDIPSRIERDHKNTSHDVSHDWDALSITQQRELSNRWAKELAPLRAFQDWWNERKAGPAPEQNIAYET